MFWCTVCYSECWEGKNRLTWCRLCLQTHWGFYEISSGLVCELDGKDSVRTANCQLACSTELPSHSVSGYLKSCATVCLRQPCLCFVPGGAQRTGMGVGGMGALTDNDGVRGDMKHFHTVELLFSFFLADSSNIWVLYVKLSNDTSLNGCICRNQRLPENISKSYWCLLWQNSYKRAC